MNVSGKSANKEEWTKDKGKEKSFCVMPKKRLSNCFYLNEITILRRNRSWVVIDPIRYFVSFQRGEGRKLQGNVKTSALIYLPAFAVSREAIFRKTHSQLGTNIPSICQSSLNSKPHSSVDAVPTSQIRPDGRSIRRKSVIICKKILKEKYKCFFVECYLCITKNSF